MSLCSFHAQTPAGNIKASLKVCACYQMKFKAGWKQQRCQNNKTRRWPFQPCILHSTSLVCFSSSIKCVWAHCPGYLPVVTRQPWLTKHDQIIPKVKLLKIWSTAKAHKTYVARFVSCCYNTIPKTREPIKIRSLFLLTLLNTSKFKNMVRASNSISDFGLKTADNREMSMYKRNRMRGSASCYDNPMNKTLLPLEDLVNLLLVLHSNMATMTIKF